LWTRTSGVHANPCIVCNQVIKFDHLIRQADEEEIAFVSTGHYAVIRRPEDSPSELWRGMDQGKEQSYFLHRLEQPHLLRMVLPLGSMTKREARLLAAKMKLPTVSEPESRKSVLFQEMTTAFSLKRARARRLAKRERS